MLKKELGSLTAGRHMKPGGYREMWRIAAPLIMSMASYTIMQFCDRVFLARYSSVAIQAALPAGILAHTMACFFQALAGYAGTFTAHYHGAKEPVQCVRATVQGLWLAMGTWPLVLALIPVGYWLMELSGHAPEVLVAERSYFRILMVGNAMISLNAAVGGYFMGVGRTKINMAANVLGCSLNVVLNYMMIFGHWGMPEMGIEGAAYATVISGCVSFIIQLAVFTREPLALAMRWRERWGFDQALCWRIVRFGTPSGLQLLMDLGAFALFIMLTGRMGALSLATSNIAFSINNLAFAPLLGIGMAASALVGQHQGARNRAAAARSGYTGVKMGLVYMCVIGATFLLFPRQYFGLFRASGAEFTVDELMATGRGMLVLMTVWGLLDTVSIILSGALKGAGDTRFVMLYLIGGSWLVLVPGTVVLIKMEAGILALWGWLAVYVCVLAVGFWWRWRSRRWMGIKLIGHETTAYIPPDTDDVF